MLALQRAGEPLELATSEIDPGGIVGLLHRAPHTRLHRLRQVVETRGQPERNLNFDDLSLIVTPSTSCASVKLFPTAVPFFGFGDPIPFGTERNRDFHLRVSTGSEHPLA